MRSLFAVAVLVFVFPPVAYSQCEVQQLATDELKAGARFGRALERDEDQCIVGAYHESVDGVMTGAAYVYVLADGMWIREARLTPEGDTDDYDNFGEAVAISGDLAVVGAWSNDSNGDRSGAAYLFRREDTGWEFLQRLETGVVDEDDRFGASVSVDGGVVAVAATHKASAENSGAVYLFEEQDDEWVLAHEITQADSIEFALLGRAIDLEGDRLLIGTSGTALLFEFVAGEWQLETELLAEGVEEGDSYGRSVCLDGGRVAIGAPYTRRNIRYRQGAVYLFEESAGQWEQVADFVAQQGSSGLGMSVELDGDRCAVGAVTFNLPGQVHLYERVAGSWQFEESLRLELNHLDSFGTAVGLQGDELLVGANRSDAAGKDSGTVVRFEMTSDGWSQVDRIGVGRVEAGDAFGSIVYGVDDCIFVGAVGDRSDPGAAASGSVSVFEQVDGDPTLVEVLFPSDPDDEDLFGRAITASDTTLWVGAPNGDGEEDDSGAVYVFSSTDDGWLEDSKLAASGGADGDRFGFSVAAVGSVLVVGAPGDEDGTGTVRTFVFESDAWLEEDSLSASDGTDGAEFGAALAFADGTLVVGAPNDDELGDAAGAVFVYGRDDEAWSDEIRLVAADGGEDDGFGTALSLSGERILIGAPGATDSGAAYVYELDGADWEQTETLGLDSDDDFSDFGIAVSLLGDLALIGHPGSGTEASAGAVTLFSLGISDWTREVTITSEHDGAVRFGASVWLGSDGYALVGTPAGFESEVRSGSVSVLQLTVQTDCNENELDDRCDVATISSRDCNGNGVPDECDLESGEAEDSNGDGSIDACGTLFKRGDVNADGVVSALVDAQALLWFAFASGSPPECMAATDIDNSGTVSKIIDALYLLSWAFLGGPEPAAPGPYECGPSVGEALECEESSGCN